MANQGGESLEDYPHIVVNFGDGCRVIECGGGIQWIVQTHRNDPKYPWKNRYFCRTKEALLHYSGHGNHPVLQALPDWFPEGRRNVAVTSDLSFAGESLSQ